jgi:AcrR family transcriptional regulator
MTPQTRNADATRAALLKAATSAFAESGFAGARTQAIADRAGVNKALIRYYFDSKQGLYSAVLLGLMERAQAAIGDAVEEATLPAGKLDAFIREMSLFMEDEPDFAPILTSEQMGGAHRIEPEVRERLFGFFGIVRGILETGIADGSFRSVDAHATHLSLIGSLLMYQLTRPARETYKQAGGLPSSIPEWPDYVEHVRRLFEIGLQPPTAQTPEGEDS